MTDNSPKPMPQNEQYQPVEKRLEAAEAKISSLEDRIVELETDLVRRKAELRAAREQLNQAEATYLSGNELLRTVLEQAGVTVFNEGNDLRIRWFLNPFPNFSNERLEGKTEAEVMPRQDAELLMGIKRRVIETGIGSRSEVLLHVDGEHCYYEYVVEPVKDDHGSVTSVLGSAVDITKRKQYETVLKEYAVQLERANQDLKEFTSIASHDLQEPLRKIKSFGKLLQEELHPNLSVEMKDILGRMSQAADRMGIMIDTLLTLSRVSAQEINITPVDLSTIARDVIGDLELSITHAQGEVEVGELPVIEADELQMHQLLQNLIGNALKYHRPGVAPRVRIWAEAKSREKITILVADNGIGFDETFTERIFQPFQRLHGRSSYAGSGMGLAICRKIVERHGGEITARSTPGEGSTFMVTLPQPIQPG